MQPLHQATLTQPLQCNIHAAITMRFAAHSFKKRIELRTQEQPLVAKHIGGTIRDRNDPSRTRRTDEVPFIAGCSHFTRKNTRFRAPASSPKHSPCNIHAAITMRFAAHSFKKRIELRTQEQPLVAKHIGGTIRDRNDPSRTRRTDEVPFIAGCSHFTRKNTRFRAPASSPKHSPCNIHAAITMRFAAHSFKKRIGTQEQPLVAKHIGGTIRDRNDPSRTRRTDELPFIVACSHFTRKNTRFRAPASSPKHSPCNIHAAITMRFAAHSFKKRIELRTQEQPLVAKHIGGTIRDRNDPSRTRRTDELPFIAGCSHFTRKNTRFRAPASSPKHSPCNIHAAITMRFAAHSFKKRIELRTQEQPLVAKHIGGTIRDRNDPSRTRRTDEVPFITGCSHFTRKNTRFRAPASSPKHSPCNIHAAITMRFAARSFKKRIELRTQEQPLVAKHIGGTIRDRNDPSRTRRTDEVPFIAGCSHFTRKNTRFRAPASSPKHSPCNIHAAITMRFAAHSFKKRTTHTGTTTRCKTHRRNNSRQKRPQPHPSHRRATFHRRLQPLYTEKHKVSCSSFLPKT